MKRTAVILGVAAAMGVFAPAAVGAKGQSDGLPVVKPAKTDRSLHTTYNSRSGQTMYRLGNSGQWME
jgi:hypothetical protein